MDIIDKEKLIEFVNKIENFDSVKHSQKIITFGYYITKIVNEPCFDQKLVRQCYESLDYPLPANISDSLQKLKDGDKLVIANGGYRVAKSEADKIDDLVKSTISENIAQIYNISEVRNESAQGINPTRTGNYFFVDIVGLSGDRLTDKQIKKIGFITEIVKDYRRIYTPKIFLTIPTGDGMAVDFNDPLGPIELALYVQDRLKDYNKRTTDEELKIQVRIGLNGGPVAIFRDSENRLNVWGDGIIMARRVMDLGDNNHILMSQRTFDDLKRFSKYSDSIQHLGNYPIKHGTMSVYSYFDGLHGSKMMPKKISENKI